MKPIDDVIAAMPYKRWSITIHGDWENGWEAEAMSSLAADPGVILTTNDSGWFHEGGGHPTPEAALAELARRLKVWVPA